MSDIHPDAVSLEDAPQPTLESQPTGQPAAEPTTPEADDAEPEGVVEVSPGKRMVDVSIVAAERRRAREAAARAKDKEYEPLRQAAAERDQLRAALAEVRPIIEQVRQHGMPKPAAPEPAEARIPDDRAERYARRFELYRADGQPDVARAKAILVEQQEETTRVAREAVQEAVGPITSHTAAQASRQNLERLALQRDPDGEPMLGRLVDPKTLARLWAQLPPELTQHPEVGELVMNAAIGETARKGGRVARPERSPVVSEPAGGRGGPGWTPNDTAKKIAREAGLTEKDLAASAKTYVPGGVNTIGD